MLWTVAVMFSAAQNALWSGNQVFISAGASVPGVFWNTMRTPSTVISSKRLLMSRVGAIRPLDPVDARLPMAWSTCPNGLAGSSRPYWYIARRTIAVPA